MKFSVMFAFAAVFAVSISTLACPNLSGTYQVTKMTSSDEGSQSPLATISINQNGCQEVDLTTLSGQAGATPATQKYITDGQAHPWGSIGDVGVTFTLISTFQGNGLVGLLGMASLPGKTIGTIKVSLDATGNTLSYSMATQGSSFEATAVRK